MADTLRVANLVIAAGILLAATGCRRAELVTAPKRALAGRLSYAALDRWRPLDEQPGAREAVSLETMARLAERGDLHGAGDLALLAGELDRAGDTLGRAPKDPAVAADLALLTLQRGDVAAALEQLDAVLRAQPDSAPAAWNRALALAALDLPLAAAQAFAAIAARREPGWSDEARRRSQALEAGWKARLVQTANDVGAAKAMVLGGALPKDDLVRRAPSMVRHFFYHAVRAAPSPARVAQLRPLAQTLDGIYGDRTLTGWLDRVATEAPDARAQLGPRYGRYMMMPSTPPAVPPAELAEFLAAVDKAHADDLLLGSLMLFGRSSPAELARVKQLVAANGDVWWQTKLAQTEASQASARGELEAASRQLEGAADACKRHHFDYRCADVEKQLALVEQDRHHTSVARRWALAAIGSARAAKMVPRFLESSVMFLLGQIARYRNDFALMRAYSTEGMLRLPESCIGKRSSHLMFGAADIFELDFDGAARELAATPACDHSAALLKADLATSLYLAGHDTPATKTVAAELHAARPTLTPSQRLQADVIEARLSLVNDRPAALALVRPAMTPRRAGLDADARKARTFAYQMLAVDAGRRGDFADAVDTLAAEAEGKAGERCALGVAIDDARVVVAARDAAGRAVGQYVGARKSAKVDAARLVPAEVRAALAGCPEVAVYALAPVNGQAELLPPELPWSYRLRAAPPAATTPTATAPAATPKRLVVSDVQPPAALGLPPLLPWTTNVPSVRWLSGAAATPARVLGELADAGEVELNAHGLIDLDLSDAWLLALSADAAGHYALTAADLEPLALANHPLFVLAACNAGRAAPYLHEPWGLPLAFIDAGARAVFASSESIPDASAGAFFDAVLARVRSGQPPAVALRDERVAWQRRDAGNWTRYVLLFQ